MMEADAFTAPSAPDVAAADLAARHWRWSSPGRLPIGSDAHRSASCRMFRETFNPYRPSIIDWPKLSPEALGRLTSLPIWDIAVQTEGKARLRMAAYGRSLTDQQPRDPKWAYLVTGYSECVDSLFAFGLFEVAERSGYFPAELVHTFEPVIQEEARHIVLFANWLAWHRRRLPFWPRIWFEMRVAVVWVFLAWERIGIARGMDGKPATPVDNNFTLTGSKSVSDIDISIPTLMTICLAENDRRFAGYDNSLLRPTTTPAIARLVTWFAGCRNRIAAGVRL